MEELWKEAHATSIGCLETLELDSSSEAAMYLMAYYGTMLECSSSALIIRNCGKYTGVEILLRTAIEAYVDIVNLLQNPKYLENLLYEFHDYWIDILELGTKGKNEFLDVFHNNTDAQFSLTSHKRHKADLKNKGVSSISISKKFEMAELKEFYLAVYAELSCEGHNNLTALISRHFEKGSDGNLEPLIFATPPQQFIDSSSDHFSGILIDGGRRLHNISKRPDAKRAFEALGEKHQTLRQSYGEA